MHFSLRLLAKQWLARLAARSWMALSASPTKHSEAVISQVGFDGISELLAIARGNAAADLLRQYGAHVGARPMIYPGLTMHNADNGFENLTVGDGCHIGRQVLIDLADHVTLGDRVTLAMRCMLLTHFHAGESLSLFAASAQHTAPVVIKHDAYVGAGAILLPGVTIGSGSLIGAGAVVTRDVADGVMVAGIPARPIKPRPADSFMPPLSM